ncbi:MAG: TonB-dependent receptor, partial [Gemmatimonadaceae bacterium]
SRFIGTLTRRVFQMQKMAIVAFGAALIAGTAVHAQTVDTAKTKRDTSSAHRALPPIVVTATRTPKTEFNAPAPVNYISSKMISERMPNSVADLFRDLPGVDVAGVGTNQVRPSIRGQGGQRILLLEDGIRMNNSRRQEDFGELPSLVGLNDIDRVEVVRGPSSVLYGTDAIAGVVNIITRVVPDYTDASIHGSASYHYGSADFQRSPSVTLEQRDGPLAFRFTGMLRQSNSYNAPAGTYGNITFKSSERVNDTGVNDNSLAGLISYDLTPGQRIIAKVEQYDARDAGFGYVDPALLGTDQPLIRILYPKQQVDKYSLRYEATALRTALADRVSVTTYTVRNSRYLAMNIFIPFGPGTPPGAGVQSVSTNYTDLSTLGIRAEATKGIAKHLITYGMDAFGDRSNNTDSSATTVVGFGPPQTQTSTTPQVPNATFQSVGAFVQGDFAVLDRLSLVLGARGQDIEARTRPATGSALISKNSTVVGTANAVYHLASSVNLIASAGRGFRAPNLVERFFNGPTPEGSGFQESNANLRPETSLNLDLGARYQNATTSFEAFTFRNMIHDGIRISLTGDSVNHVAAYQNVNVDRLLFTGAEAAGQTLLGNAILLRASYTRLSSRDELNPDNPIGASYSSKTIGEVDYRPDGGRWTLGYEIRHNAKMSDGEIAASPVGIDLPAFTVHTARASVRVLEHRGLSGTLNLSVENLGNALYSEAANASFFRPQAGRNLLASWTFGF